MLRSLRKKFILIAMLSVSFVLLIIISGINISSYFKIIIHGKLQGVKKPFSNYEGHAFIDASHKCTVRKICTKCIMYI